jgi:D-inositol-3-phosphate glycosyltransferase
MSKPLRIALISEHASPLACIGGADAGGQNIYVDHVARKLAARGHRVDVFTRRDDAAAPEVVQLAPRARVIHVTAGPACFIPKEAMFEHMPAFARATERIAATAGYDVVHANFFMSGMVARHLRRRLGLPFVMTFHALGLVRRLHQKEADAFPLARIDVERAIVRDADTIIAECPQDWADLTRLYGAPESRLTMVPCGFDSAEFSPMPRGRAREQLGLPPDEFIVLQLGRLVPRKGIDNVIRAGGIARGLLPAGAKLRLLVVGGDGPVPDEARTPEIRRLRRVAEESGVADQVTFTGHRQRAELRRYYAASDVFATTPWYEPFGITPLEAMACNIPVLASRVGGLQYSVADGATGFLVPPQDPEALAQRIVELQQNPVLAAALGYAGGRRAQAMFTWDRVVDSLLDIYMAVRRPVAPARRGPREAFVVGAGHDRRAATAQAIGVKGAAQ